MRVWLGGKGGGVRQVSYTCMSVEISLRTRGQVGKYKWFTLIGQNFERIKVFLRENYNLG